MVFQDVFSVLGRFRIIVIGRRRRGIVICRGRIGGYVISGGNGPHFCGPRQVLVIAALDVGEVAQLAFMVALNILRNSV